MTDHDPTESVTETQRATLPHLVQGITHLADLSEVLKKMGQELVRQEKEVVQPFSPHRSLGDDSGETRSFYLSPELLEDERELFQEHGANNISDLLGVISNSMYGTVMLMQNQNHESLLPGFAVQMLGDSLWKYLELLGRVQNYFSDVKLVQVSNA